MSGIFGNNESSEISLRLEKYTDIFSDFDIRPYGKRALSVDFLDELRRASSEAKGEIEIVFHLPEKERKEYEEGIIKERLTTHFKRHYHILSEEKNHILKIGFLMVILGIAFMILATNIVFEGASRSMLTSFSLVFLEPAAWFLLWEGADQLLFNSKSTRRELSFYRKMSDAHKRIFFKSY